MDHDDEPKPEFYRESCGFVDVCRRICGCFSFGSIQQVLNQHTCHALSNKEKTKKITYAELIQQLMECNQYRWACCGCNCCKRTHKCCVHRVEKVYLGTPDTIPSLMNKVVLFVNDMHGRYMWVVEPIDDNPSTINDRWNDDENPVTLRITGECHRTVKGPSNNRRYRISDKTIFV